MYINSFFYLDFLSPIVFYSSLFTLISEYGWPGVARDSQAKTISTPGSQQSRYILKWVKIGGVYKLARIFFCAWLLGHHPIKRNR